MLIDDLIKLGLYRGKKPNPMTLGVCSRSGDVIEPVLRPQWWVNCQGMAVRAMDAVKSKQLQILPAQSEETWFRWLEHIQDWCISRQVKARNLGRKENVSSFTQQHTSSYGGGHRVPAYFVTIDGVPRGTDDSNDCWVVGRTDAEAMENARAKFPGYDAAQIHLTRDDDVLDTWFSSALFPFAVMGWPADTADMRHFYPNTLLETGADILFFFWVARMVMLGLQLTNRLPFATVYLHSMVRDKMGRKMSKSRGNVIDPLDVIHGTSLEALLEKLAESNLDAKERELAAQLLKDEFPQGNIAGRCVVDVLAGLSYALFFFFLLGRLDFIPHAFHTHTHTHTGIPECGADALRYGLIAYTAQGKDINLDMKRIVGYRHFHNKPWQATRLALQSFGPEFKPPRDLGETCAPVKQTNRLADRWILSRLARAVQRVHEGFVRYELSEVAEAVHHFWLHDLCDVYLELIKRVIYSADQPQQLACVRAVLYTETSETNGGRCVVCCALCYLVLVSVEHAVAAESRITVNGFLPRAADPGRQKGGRRRGRRVLTTTCLDHALRLMHPLSPFLTEELYQRLHGTQDSVAETKDPTGHKNSTETMDSGESKGSGETPQGVSRDQEPPVYRGGALPSAGALLLFFAVLSKTKVIHAQAEMEPLIDTRAEHEMHLCQSIGNEARSSRTALKITQRVPLPCMT